LHCSSTNRNLSISWRITPKISRNFIKIPLAMVALLMLSACPNLILHDDDDTVSSAARPVYLSYEELRSAVAVEAERTVRDIGRIYLFGNYFFLNDRNSGVHIFNNTDPTSPLNEGYINIPGNTELAIRDGFLYADSYVDLVTLDINNMSDIKVSSRIEDIFPWNPYQNVPESIFFNDSQLDKTRGVIVGYE